MTENLQLRRSLRRALQGAGSTVEFASAERAEGLGGFDLVVVDSVSRHLVDLERLGARQVLVVGESLAEAEVLDLLRARDLNHVVAATDDPTFLVTSGKLRGGDIFGVEKYLAWGALVHERSVASYDEKRRALADLARFAVEAGARRQVAARVEDVADELLMNALYDAPAVRLGVSVREATARGPGEPAVLRFGCDGRMLGVAVRDGYGELTKAAIVDSVTRARAQRGPVPSETGGGAGLGLHMVVCQVVRFVANIDPGRLTEVIGLFDLDATGREQASCAKSLHIFTTQASG